MMSRFPVAPFTNPNPPGGRTPGPASGPTIFHHHNKLPFCHFENEAYFKVAFCQCDKVDFCENADLRYYGENACEPAKAGVSEKARPALNRSTFKICVTRKLDVRQCQVTRFAAPGSIFAVRLHAQLIDFKLFVACAHFPRAKVTRQLQLTIS
jgi:hypothetical protein